MINRALFRTVVLAAFGALLALAAVACSSDDDPKVVDQVTTTSASSDAEQATIDEDDSSDPDESLEDDAEEKGQGTSDPLVLDNGVVVSEVTCSNSGIEPDIAPEGEVPCSERHDAESVTVTGVSDLEDCYGAITTMSDIVGITGDDGDLEIDDDRISGHAFGGYDGEYQCQISLAEPRTEPFLHR